MLDPATYQMINIESRDDGLVLATLNRPGLNIVDLAMHKELARLPRDVQMDPDVRVLVITGAGRAFCAGGDMGLKDPDNHQPFSHEDARQMVDHILVCSKPIISAVNGYAMGLGATIALLADVVFAARSAQFADSHVKMALGAGDGGQVIWPFLMGVNRAKYYMMTGDLLGAEEAERLGLVNFIVDDDKLLDAALALGTRLATGPAEAIAASKVGINAFLRMVCNLVLPLTLSAEAMNLKSDDHREAKQAFRDKRPPEFATQAAGRPRLAEATPS